MNYSVLEHDLVGKQTYKNHHKAEDSECKYEHKEPPKPPGDDRSSKCSELIDLELCLHQVDVLLLTYVIKH